MSFQRFSKTFSLFQKSTKCLKKSLMEISRTFSTLEAEPAKVESSGSEQSSKKVKKSYKERVDRHVANVACAQSICQMLPKKCEYVLEGSPGVGVVTEALLRTKPELNVRVYEPMVENSARMEELRRSFGEKRLKLHRTSLWQLSSYSYKDRVHGTKFMDDMFADLEPRSWDDDPPFLMLGPVPTSMERNFVAALPAMLCDRSAMYAYGRAQFMVYVSHHTYRIMTATRKDPFRIYVRTSVLFHLLFDVELLAKEPLSSFSVQGKTDQTKLVHKKYDESHLYLVRVTPKARLAFDLPPNVSLKELGYFVQQTFSNRTAFVIDKLDAYIPRGGPRLISLGYTTTTRFGDLGAVEVAHLFREFSSWPEYEHCQFKSMARADQERFDTTAD